MTTATLACPRCASSNHHSNRFCDRCGLPVGAARGDPAAVLDLLGPPETLDPGQAAHDHLLRDFAHRSGYEYSPFGPGWRIVVPLPLDRKQAVYLSPAGDDPEGRPLISLLSVCGAANDRDARSLLRLNARSVEGHFAIRVLRGEEYFVVIQMLTIQALAYNSPAPLVRRIATTADGLEDRLTRGLDLF